MRLMIATAIVAAVCCAAETPLDPNDLSQCSDRNALNGVSVDASLTAIKFYYAGFIQALTDEKRRACYQAKTLGDERLAIVNKARDLIERNCMPIEAAARIAAEGACP